MIEEQITKKTSRGKRLFKGLIATAKYLFIAVLVFSLIAGLLLQAPWKVLTLIAIILAALTVIPKPARKWIWMTFGLIIIALIIWVFLPDNDSSDWKPFTFKDEIAAFEAARAVPDEDNAATIYNQLLVNYDEGASDPNFRDEDSDNLTMNWPWLSGDHTKIAQWLQEHQNTIATLIQASRKDKCSLPTYFDTVGLAKHPDIIFASKHWVFLLICGANNDLGHGRIDQAITKYIAALKLGDHLNQQPTTIDILVGYAIESMALDMFRAFAVTPYATEQHLDALEKTIEDLEYNWQSYWSTTIGHEKLFLKNTTLAVFYEVNSKYETRFTRDPTAAFRAQFIEMGLEHLKEDFDTVPTYWQKKFRKASTILGWIFWPTAPQEAGKIIDDVYQRYYAMAKPDFDWNKGPEKFSFTSIRLNFRTLIKMLAFLP
jgi:tetratricopeptide (TPR) repeat protein